MVEIENYPGPIAENVVETLENNRGIKLPHQYRKFLIEYNGGRPVPDCFWFREGTYGDSSVEGFLGIGGAYYCNIQYYLETFQDRVLASFFPIAYDVFGNMIVIGLCEEYRGQIFFWHHEEECEEGQTPDMSNMYFVANRFDEFLESLYEFEE